MVNPNNCKTIIHMNMSMSMKEVVKLYEMFTTMDKFVSKSTQHVLLPISFIIHPFN